MNVEPNVYIERKAKEFSRKGIKPLDALHLGCEYFLTVESLSKRGYVALAKMSIAYMEILTKHLGLVDEERFISLIRGNRLIIHLGGKIFLKDCPLNNSMRWL